MKKQELKLVKEEVVINLRMSIFLLPSQLIPILNAFITVVFIAHLGHDALAASALVSVLWSALVALFVGILGTISILVSHYCGAADYKGIEHFMRNIWPALVLMSLLLILLFTSSPYFFAHLKLHPNVIFQTQAYVYALLWAAPALLYYIALENFLLGLGKTQIGLIANLAILILNLFLSFILAFGLLNLPKLGIRGIGSGYASAYFLTSLGLSSYLFSSDFKTHRIFLIKTIIGIVNS
ncbi:MATE family efflux transporter [Legionella gresilensis]|uniref:MATE family efflux transporter n=1 Tax=Legionella gresilensis TaxID=91823 RepID=UPI0010414B24|nr:MATE family efflux transporter [Legionella gresilensis]